MCRKSAHINSSSLHCSCDRGQASSCWPQQSTAASQGMGLCDTFSICIDLFGANSHLIQSRLKIDVTPISLIQVTPLGGKELLSPNRCSKNSCGPEMPTKQRYSKKLPSRELSGLGKPINGVFCCSAALLASQVCLNLCYSDWATVALSHQGV